MSKKTRVKNWTPGEAIRVLREGTDIEAIQDIARRLPLFAINCMSEEGLIKIVENIPHLSARQLNTALMDIKEFTKENDEEEAEEEKEEKTVKKEKSTKKTVKKEEIEDEDDEEEIEEDEEDDEDDEEDDWDDEEEEEKEAPDFSKMSQKELMQAAKELGCKIKKGMKKSDVVAMLEKAVGKPVEDEEDDEDDWDI